MASKPAITTGGKGNVKFCQNLIFSLHTYASEPDKMKSKLTQRVSPLFSIYRVFPRTVDLYVPVFETDPVINYLLCSKGDAAARKAYLPHLFRMLLKAASLNDASFDEIGDYEAAAVLMPPGRKVDNTWTLLPAGFIGGMLTLGWGGFKRMLLEYTPKTEAAKARAIHKGEKFYYVFFIGTRQDCRGRGHASAIIRHYQTIAAKNNNPIWMEATTSYSRDIYLRLGFVVTEEIVLGKGVVGADGALCEGGQGVPIWGMVWRPGGTENGTKEKA